MFWVATCGRGLESRQAGERLTVNDEQRIEREGFTFPLHGLWLTEFSEMVMEAHLVKIDALIGVFDSCIR